MPSTSLKRKIVGMSEPLAALGQAPLATVDDLVGLSGLSRSKVYAVINEFFELGLAVPVELGWTRRKTARWYLTDQGMDIVDEILGPNFQPCSRWHEEWGRSRLVERLPMVEWAYRAAGELSSQGPIQEIQWVDSVSFDVGIRLRHGWAALIWSGALQREIAVRKRVQDFGRDMVELSTGWEAAWPGLLGFVVSDKWQEELVYRVVDSAGTLRERVAVWCVSEDTRSGAKELLASRGWVRKPEEPRDMGGWSWGRRIAASPWARPRPIPLEEESIFRFGYAGSETTARILDLLAQRPNCPTTAVKHALGETPQSRSAQNRLKKMQEEQLVERVRLPKAKGYRYTLTSKGMDILVKADRVVSPPRKKKKPKGSPGGRRRGSRQTHEDQLTWLLACLMRAGVPVATGERSWEHLGDGGISPDAMAYFADSPYGAVWFYVELERTTRTRDRVDQKLRGYANLGRQDSFPVMLICISDEAEAHFQRFGAETEIKMVTTTLDRLDCHGPIGSAGCWSIYGRQVTFPMPRSQG